MKCEKHPEVQMQEVCGDFVCGACFADSMVGQRVVEGPKHPGHGRIDGFSSNHGRVWVYDGESPVGDVFGRHPWT